LSKAALSSEWREDGRKIAQHIRCLERPLAGSGAWAGFGAAGGAGRWCWGGARRREQAIQQCRQQAADAPAWPARGATPCR